MSKNNGDCIYVLEDNKIAQSTPTEKTFFGDIRKIVSGYGMSYFKCNSDNIESMISAINSAIQERKPCFIHLETKRLSSHSKSDDNRDDKFIETLFVDDILHNKLSEGAMSYDDDYIVEIKNLFDEVKKDERKISMATIYNTLKQFTSLGLIREIVVDQNKSLYCNNNQSHYHLYIEDEGKVIDIPTQNIDLDIPSIPACLKLHDIDVIVRIRTLKDKNS